MLVGWEVSMPVARVFGISVGRAVSMPVGRGVTMLVSRGVSMFVSWEVGKGVGRGYVGGLVGKL